MKRATAKEAKKEKRTQRARKPRAQNAASEPLGETVAEVGRRDREREFEPPDALSLLEVAVPLWLHEFFVQAKTLDVVLREGREAGEVVAEKGDVLQFKGKGTGEAFNALAKGLACLSFAPGGVAFGGWRYESHPNLLLRWDRRYMRVTRERTDEEKEARRNRAPLYSG